MQISSSLNWNTTTFSELGARSGQIQQSVADAAEGVDPQAGPEATEQAPAVDRIEASEILSQAARSGDADLSDRPPQEQAEISELKRRDQEVRQHEAAHMAAGGGFVQGGASYTYQPGPDGRRYAVGGEVSIDASPVANNPEATIAKMEAIQRAALAPARPSGQDLAVAARAAQAEMQARMDAAGEAMRAVSGAPEAEEIDPSNPEGDATGAAEPTSPSDAVGPQPVSTGSLLDAYA